MKSIDQLEREFLYQELGDGSSRESLNSLRRRYYASLGLVSSPSESLSSLEDKWLDFYISDNSLTPGGDYSGEWMQMVGIVGGTPSKYINDNKRLFYTLSLAVIEGGM